MPTGDGSAINQEFVFGRNLRAFKSDLNDLELSEHQEVTKQLPDVEKIYRDAERIMCSILHEIESKIRKWTFYCFDRAVLDYRIDVAIPKGTSTPSIRIRGQLAAKMATKALAAQGCNWVVGFDEGEFHVIL